MFTKVRTYVRAHRIISAIAAILVVGGGYWWYSAANAAPTFTKYVVTAATTGTIVSSVSATGQVQAGTTINITPKVSETVTRIPVVVGQHVNAGQLLIQLDPTNEQRALASAQLALEQAQLNLQETQQVSTTTLLQDQNAVTTGVQAVADASTTLANDYMNGFTSLGPVFVNLQTVMTGMQAFMTGNDLSGSQKNPDAFVSLMPDFLRQAAVPYAANLQGQYTLASAAYQQDLADYRAASAHSDPATLDALFSETANTAQAVSATVKAARDLLSYVMNNYPTNANGTQSLPAVTNTFQTDFSDYTNTMSSVSSGIQGTITTIANDKNNVVNTQDSLMQASETLSELIAGPTQTTLLGQQIDIQTAENNLQTAQENLAYTSVTAPISGTVSAIAATIGTTAGSDAVTMVGDGEVAEVTLNEIDAAKVQLGDKATLTFDALPGLSLAGTVAEIDPVGTVNQGVVSYNVQIGFSQPADTSSSMQVKPGMSVTANIVTAVAQNVIAVPSAAITTSNGTSYITEPAPPLSASDLAASANGGIALASGIKMVPVTVGVSNSTEVEIVSGVNVGDQIVVQTVKSSGGSAKTTASSGGGAFQLLGGAGRVPGGAFRAGGG